MIIRKATRTDARQIAEIIVEDWKNAYRGIIDSDYLDSMSVEERYQRELQRYHIYRVAAFEKEILGFTWNEIADNEDSDCEIIALYVRYEKRKSGIGRILFQNSIDFFRASRKATAFTWRMPWSTTPRNPQERSSSRQKHSPCRTARCLSWKPMRA